MKKKKRNFLTLIEIMIVIVLIGLITGVLAFNMRGSLDQGKAFKTEQGGGRIYKILMLEVASGEDMQDVASQWKKHVTDSSLAKNADDLCKDGWGKEYQVEAKDDDIWITSERYSQYLKKKYPNQDKDDRLT